jgi:hypothetical protein
VRALVQGLVGAGCYASDVTCQEHPAPGTRHAALARGTRQRHPAPAPCTRHPAPGTPSPCVLKSRPLSRSGPLSSLPVDTSAAKRAHFPRQGACSVGMCNWLGADATITDPRHEISAEGSTDTGLSEVSEVDDLSSEFSVWRQADRAVGSISVSVVSRRLRVSAPDEQASRDGLHRRFVGSSRGSGLGARDSRLGTRTPRAASTQMRICANRN